MFGWFRVVGEFVVVVRGEWFVLKDCTGDKEDGVFFLMNLIREDSLSFISILRKLKYIRHETSKYFSID